MTRVGITGHQVIPPEVTPYVVIEIRQLLAKQQHPLTGYSSLAAGADQLFAKELLSQGGDLHAVIPSSGYESTFSGANSEAYQSLLHAASARVTLNYPSPTERAFDAAGRWVVEQCQVLIAVWDGKPARGRGGTADTVAYARKLGRGVHIVWPSGASRD